jgi:flavin reductase (DIM6/NTAB) family NADH-FMN oxidoreductase RutF
MKKINALLLVAVVALSGFLVTSCKKETTEAAMIVKNWNMESKTLVGVSVASNCETNSSWNFRSDGTFAIHDSCDNIQTGTWELAADAKTLTLNGITVYQVIEISIGKLVIEMQVGGYGLIRWSFN